MSQHKEPSGETTKLRGERLKQAALREVEKADTWEAPVCWSTLARRLGVSRQAIATKREVVDALRSAKARVANKKAGQRSERQRTVDARIEELQQLLQDRERQLGVWVEKWVTVEFNCRALGLDPDAILTPLQKPSR